MVVIRDFHSRGRGSIPRRDAIKCLGNLTGKMSDHRWFDSNRRHQTKSLNHWYEVAIFLVRVQVKTPKK